MTTAKWLTERNRSGRRRVEVLGWARLARLWRAARPGSRVRRMIGNEARRCGYTPRVILALHG